MSQGARQGPWAGLFYKSQPKEDTLNKYRIVIELDTYSEAPEDWVIDSIGENLEEDESIVSLTIEKV